MADHHHHHHQGGGMREYRKGNWTLQETMVLIEAKRMDDERRQMKKQHHHTHHGHHHGHPMPMIPMMPIHQQQQQAQKGKQPTELRWKWVEDYCWSKGCYRSQNQCNDKWDNLMRDYKKVRDYQRRLAGAGDGIMTSPSSSNPSYWKMERGERKDRNLPTNMSPQIYDALVEVVERGVSPVGPPALPPPPVAGGGGAEGGFGFGVSSACGTSGGGVLLPPVGLTFPAPAPTTTTQPVQIAGSDPLSEHPDSSQPKRRRATTPQEHIQIHSPHLQQPQPQQQVQEQEEQEEFGRATTSGDRDSPLMMTTSASSLHEAVTSAISSSASVIAEAIRASHEGDERRHREMMSLQERMLEIDKSKLEINSAMVDAINKLASSINSLANSSKP